MPSRDGTRDSASLADFLQVLRQRAWLIVLIAAHIAAAVKHRFIDRDGVFERMLVWRKPGATAGN